ncbi:glycoside hydrolase family 18 protein [Spirosoma oryzicola]|uniref:glycoside hydrolase family 18 protein n=1 Tax=Spirosoma oryzicola TaxID=2898794 RepID=UPI001E6473EE|nr:glycoside hydrolase family 18 protein [Spirosoma oryzicola]UHG89294.1 glycoside hydrolase family 18 protein [Spirosoma oryzicola]
MVRLLFFLPALFSLAFLTIGFRPAPKTKPIVLAYVGGFRGLVDTDRIAAEKLTHINYAFVDIKNNRAWLHNLATDSTNFRKLNALKRRNPDLKILISIGGWAWSENFSDAVLSDTSRTAFAASAADIVRQYQLDGIDIDWEYPGMKGEDNVFRPEDKENFTLLFKALREQLNGLKQQTGKNYLVTTAMPGFNEIFTHTDMAQAHQYLDYINVMSYDHFTGGLLAGHHTNLYPSRKADNEQSGDRAVMLYKQAGVPAQKLVLGIAFYGRAWQLQNADPDVHPRSIAKVERGGGYTFIKDSLLTNPAYKRHWDRHAKAPYLYNSDLKRFVSYDDEQSVKEKCRYVKKNGLAGVMFWEYFSDPKTYLLTEIDKQLAE